MNNGKAILFSIKCNKCDEESVLKMVDSKPIFEGNVDLDFPYRDRAGVILSCFKCKNEIQINL